MSQRVRQVPWDRNSYNQLSQSAGSKCKGYGCLNCQRQFKSELLTGRSGRGRGHWCRAPENSSGHLEICHMPSQMFYQVFLGFTSCKAASLCLSNKKSEVQICLAGSPGLQSPSA